jgi:cytochrome P450
MIINQHSHHRRIPRYDLPPSPRHPRILQTVGGRRWPFAYLERCRAHLGDKFTLYPLDMPPIVFLANPDDIRTMIAADPSDLHPGAGASIIAPLIGKRSFMLLEEEDHICGRRTITPAFHQRTVEHHTKLLSETVEHEIARWPLDTVLPMHQYVRALALKVILKAIFSKPSNSHEHENMLHTLHDRLMEMLTVTSSLILQEPKLRYAPGWHGTWRRFLRQRIESDRLILALVHRRRAEAGTGTGRATEKAGAREDLLDMLLAAKNHDGSPMSHAEIRDNLMSMILAGHETTTGELTWAFQLLAHTPRVQDLLAEEIDNGTEEEYLTATVHETMRRKPVFLFIIPRKVVNPLQIGDWTYSPPAHLAGCTYLMHHDPQLFPRPHEFRPERFIEEAQQARTWLPWGGGRKHCLGRHFALLEVKTILREVLATRTVLPAARRIEPPRWRSAIIVPRKGGRVILRRR